ncbi:hypothetical protein ACFWXK_10750 [Streptomyces sp. NPDC059070]|uniref:hypothetical protein n=1 Tax=Streptomyces sp. NPDC059070 TaxID=3346713 RepID=UPI0036C0F673
MKLDGYLHERTDGAIGGLSQLVRGAALEAIINGSEAITRKTLETIEVDQTAEDARQEHRRNRRPRRRMPTQPDRLRQLPVALGPVHNETLGSYLHRLAVANNRPAGFLARLLGPLPPEFSPLSNTTAGWTPHSPGRLAVLSGRPMPQFARALPALADFLSPRGPGQRTERLISRPCRCCTASRSPTASVAITLAPAHVHLCPRHQLWTRSTHDIPLGVLPEVIKAQRRLDQFARRHRKVRQALDLARKIVEDWSASGMPIDLGKMWADRLDRVEALAVSKKVSAEDPVTSRRSPRSRC